MFSRRNLLGAPLAAFSPPRRHNIIVILADDLGYGDLGSYGSARGVSPHLDRLADDGVRFTDHYSCSPVCSPARAGLLTGRVPQRTGVTGVLRDADDSTGLSLGCRTLAEELREQGWRTALIGKWHLGMAERYRPARRGFDYFWGFLNGTIDYYTHRSLGGGATGRRTTYENETPAALEGYFPELATAKAVEFVEANRSRPYFLFLSLALPHAPLQAPERWVKPFRGRMTEIEATYAGMLRCLDDGVGRVRAALERTGQWERTTVMFTSDNGWVKKRTPQVARAGSNGPFRGGKYELFEGGIRVPCIVRWPGLTKPGAEIRTPCWFPDWYPTLSGRPTPDGVDLRPILSGKAGDAERALCWQFADELVDTPPSAAIRMGDWKWLRIGAETQLVNLDSDPGETNDVKQLHPDLAAALDRRLSDWMKAATAHAAHRSPP